MFNAKIVIIANLQAEIVYLQTAIVFPPFFLSGPNIKIILTGTVEFVMQSQSELPKSLL